MSEGGCPDENDLLAFVEHRRTGTVAAHLLDCERCRHLVALLGEPEVAEPQSLGRYQLAGVIGRGGMGVVHRGLDPRLGRHVALKTVRLRGEDAAAESELLKREAAAMARLSHPNVVQVFDVGREGPTLYIAMELVDGMSLATWMRNDHGWHARLNMLEQIARGVEAAHAAGILHRDLKPSNVLVRADGRAMVADFGIAGRIAERLPTRPGTGNETAGVAVAEDGSTTTLRGAGTAPYMAPEQHDGAASNERTDVYALAAMAYEVILGVRPFPADRAEARAAKLSRSFATPSEGVPMAARWIRSALIRGLEPDPADRWPTVRALRQALTRGSKKRRRWAVWGSAVTASVLVLGGATWGVASPSRDDACDDANRIEGEWEAAASAFDDALNADASALRSPTVTATQARANRFVGEWVSAWREVCGTELATAERACLRRRQGVVEGLLQAMDNPSAKLSPGLGRATAELDSIRACFEADGTRDGSEYDRELAKISVLLEVGENDKARRELDAAVQANPESHRGPLWDYVEMRLAFDGGRYPDVIEVGERGYLAAVREGRDEAAAKVALLVAQALAVAGRGLEAKPWLRHAEAALRRAGIALAGRADFQQTTMLVLQATQDLEGAEQHGERAVEVLGSARPVVVTSLASSLNDLANVRIMAGKYNQAEEAAAEGANLVIAAYGNAHRLALILRATEANLKMRSGELEDAAVAFRQIDAILSRDPTKNPSMWRLARMNHATAELRLEHWAEGRALILEILPELERDSSGAMAYASALNNLAAAEIELGELDSAEARFQRLLALHRERSGDDSLEVATAHSQLGAVALAAGRLDGARKRYTVAIEWFDRNRPEHGSLSYALVGLADAEVASGRSAPAVPLLERALGIRNAGGFSPGQIEEVEQKIAAAQASQAGKQ